MNSFVLIFEDENRYATSEDFMKGIPDKYKEYLMPSWRSKSRASQAGPVAQITDADIQRCFIESNRERWATWRFGGKRVARFKIPSQMDATPSDRPLHLVDSKIICNSRSTLPALRFLPQG